MVAAKVYTPGKHCLQQLPTSILGGLSTTLPLPGLGKVCPSFCELAGNHPKKVTSEALGTSGCSSPVERRRKYTPVLSEYARYLPSGDIAEAMIPFSVAFVVKRCNVTEPCDNFDRDAWRHRNHPPTMLATTTKASTARPKCHFYAQGPEAIVGNPSVGIRPVSVSRFRPLRSDRADRVVISTLPMKRYPRRASVSTKMGASADSPNASRNLLMAAFRL